jgi:ureidoglycolate lyase
MKQVPIKELSLESFKNYGTFSSLINPDRPNLGTGIVTFYRDMEVLDLGQSAGVAFSVTRIEKRPFMIDAMECHSKTGESILPLDGDVLIHVAPATLSSNIPLDKVEVFYVPKGTIVTLRKGVWHCAPYAYTTDYVNVMVALPERTYENDCLLHFLPKEDQIEIKMK